MTKALLLAVAAFACATAAYADAGDIKARQQHMKDFRGLNKEMGNIIKKSNAQNFPAQQFAHLAQTLNQSAHEPWPYYQSAGANGKGSEATAAVWEKPQDFQAAIKRFTDAAAALDQAAQTGRYEAVRTPLGQLGQSCKACHDTFKD